jgi:hypothetical protein
MSANTLLHLYAPGSNGIVDFVSNVTLSSSASAVAIAGNTVTIENGVIVTIAGTTPANVFANVANYSARNGGNGKTTGIFAGAGATTQALGGQPPFVATRATPTNQARSVTSTGGKTGSIHITDSSQLASLVNNATPGTDGKVHISSASPSRNASAQHSAPSASVGSQPHRSADAKISSPILAMRSP